MKFKIFGFLEITKNQFIIIETVLFVFFFLLTIFFFSYTFPEYIDNPLILFHAKYLKYVSLTLSFLIVVETQYYLNKLIGKQLEVNSLQKKKISKQNKEIKESIYYASHIQNALLSAKGKIPKYLDYFIFYKPKDIVSGDYYWFFEKCGKLIIVVADCTGHGVPGAFMSVLGISSLNEIVTETDKCLNSDEILNSLRSRIINSLEHKEEDLISEAGMDLSIIIYDRENYEVQFSGAKNPLFILRNKKEGDIEISNIKKTELGNFALYQVKADNMPIGKYPRMEPFSKEIIKLKKNDTLYMFSDGFADQFGGKFGKRLMIKRFRELLLRVQEKNMKEQEVIFEAYLNKWKNTYEQTDDIIVMGIRID